MSDRRDQEDDDAEYLGGPPIVHNHYERSDARGTNINTVMLGCLLAIVGFLGVQIWLMSARLTGIETVVNILLARSGITIPLR